MNDLDQQVIEQTLTTQWLGRPVHYLPEVGSTNERLRALADAGAPGGTLVITDYQSAGRGRMDRRWEAPPGTSLLFSLLFRPDWPLAQVTWLTMLAGLAAVAAIRRYPGVRAGLKWPNDVMIETPRGWRKTGGLLANSALSGERLAYVIVGIGLNCNISEEEMPQTNMPATSLLLATSTPVERLPLLAALLAHFEAGYAAASDGHSPQPAWNRQLMMLGERVRLTGPRFVLEGTAEATDAKGQLMIRDDAGTLHAIAAGDVSLRGT